MNTPQVNGCEYINIQKGDCNSEGFFSSNTAYFETFTAYILLVSYMTTQEWVTLKDDPYVFRLCVQPKDIALSKLFNDKINFLNKCALAPVQSWQNSQTTLKTSSSLWPTQPKMFIKTCFPTLWQTMFQKYHPDHINTACIMHMFLLWVNSRNHHLCRITLFLRIFWEVRREWPPHSVFFLLEDVLVIFLIITQVEKLDLILLLTF